jgi:hypothetical protein
MKRMDGMGVFGRIITKTTSTPTVTPPGSIKILRIGIDHSESNARHCRFGIPEPPDQFVTEYSQITFGERRPCQTWAAKMVWTKAERKWSLQVDHEESIIYVDSQRKLRMIRFGNKWKQKPDAKNALSIEEIIALVC